MKLVWAPGIEQVSMPRALVTGVERDVRMMMVSISYSSMRFCAALPGENAECVCVGLAAVLDEIDVVPRDSVFSNTTMVGHWVRSADRDDRDAQRVSHVLSDRLGEACILQ
jgi:hypothetical protein